MKGFMNRLLIASLTVLALMLGSVGAAQAADPPVFEINDFIARAIDADGNDYTVAGGHPDEAVTSFSFPTRDSEKSGLIPVEPPKSTFTDLPPGFLANLAGVARCPLSKLTEGAFTPNCPPATQVGTMRLDTFGNTGFPIALYNMVPERGYPFELGFKVLQNAIVLYPRLSSRADGYRGVVAVPGAADFGFTGAEVHVFGVPSERTGVGGPPVPALINPTDCLTGAPVTRMIVDSWTQPGRLTVDGFPDLTDSRWKTAVAPAPPVTGCEDPQLAEQFEATAIEATPVQAGGGPIQADQPAGLEVDLHFLQANDPTDPSSTIDPEIPATPPLKNATVTLPAGVSISPSAADGLEGCSDLASDAAGDQVRYEDTLPVTCPDASKLGTVVGTSPLLASHDPVTDAVTGAEPIRGDVYIVKPHPGDLAPGGAGEGTFRVLIQLESAKYGVNVKLPGTVKADGQSGRLTATFLENPQLPVKDLHLEIEPDPRAALATPVTCGAFTTSADLVPWSTPGTPDAHPSSSFEVASGPNGSPCAETPGARPFAPALTAGTQSAGAGQSSPFVLRLTRKDGEQELSSLQVTLPKGLAAKFAGIPYCSDAALAAAATKPGKAEQANPSCPASRLGSVIVGAGPGTHPFHAQGTAYLSGPYKGAPMSVAVITPAVAGPFDLGTVVVRNALYVDPETAQGRVVSDPFPKILDGVPLRLRDVTVALDRPDFTLNPTNCEPMSVQATLTSTDGATANAGSHFQVGDCKALGFKPKLKLSLKGGTKRSDNPSLRAVLTYPKGNYANIARAAVSLPRSEFLAQEHIRTICTRVQFAADQCPKGSIYGHATATTPLLEQPLSGPVYLRSSDNLLPDLVAALHGQIDIDLVGRIDSKDGGIRTTFDAVPDAPVSRFVLTMQGGQKSLLDNSENLCKSVNRADVRFTAQNGRTLNSKPVLTNGCKKKNGKGKQANGKGKAHKRTLAWLSGLGF
ncbi:MAG TPA: hypothetical protein VLK37_11015 [Solirubrobacterales bacterium]|nr:hypothetical protein [Solirubrobacterales bacterium]